MSTQVKPRKNYNLRVFVRDHTSRTPKSAELASFGTYIYKNASEDFKSKRKLDRSSRSYLYSPDMWPALEELFDAWRDKARKS